MESSVEKRLQGLLPPPGNGPGSAREILFRDVLLLQLAKQVGASLRGIYDDENNLRSEELAHRSAQLVRSMEVLNEREKHILNERRLKEEPATLEQLSKVYGISRERVRQIEARAFEKLQRAMHAAAQTERENERSAALKIQ